VLLGEGVFDGMARFSRKANVNQKPVTGIENGLRRHRSQVGDQLFE